MTAIKAIETQYKGYKFRSRLEARWAVFFDTLGLKWDYEVQGFDLDGVRYLPDFWIPSYGVYFEIKPEDEYDFRKPRALADAGKTVYVLQGNPWPWEYMAWRLIRGSKLPFPTAQFAHCNVCAKVALVISAIAADTCLYMIGESSNFDDWQYAHKAVCEGAMCWPIPRNKPDQSPVWRAYTAARSARFEFGETPK